jgi:glycosyltransferase involved in cell wall biosynthesis
LHGRLDLPELPALYRQFREMPVVSISDAQREPLPWLNWQATVHHGIPLDLHSFQPDPGDYLLFLGRISPEKRPDRAIEIASRAGIPLKIAAKVDKADEAYFNQCIKPLLRNPLVDFAGEVGGSEKDKLLANALALVFPIDWPEPFGLVMIEALACGTPVIACCRGSVPEIVEDGVTGYLIEGVDDGVLAVERVGALDRRRCRDAVERRFSASRMARDYLSVYERVTARRRRHVPRSAHG